MYWPHFYRSDRGNEFELCGLIIRGGKQCQAQVAQANAEGDVITFQTFWDCFNSAMNNNPDLQYQLSINLTTCQ